MYIANPPEDSTLHRHYESARAFQYQAFLARPPTDSVLRRHYEQQRSAAGAATNPAPPRDTRPAKSTSAPALPQTGSSGGLLGWLRRLFG